MTAGALITLMNELVPNVFSDDVKMDLINEIEAKIQMQVFLQDAKDVELIATADKATAVLCLPDARKSLYVAWMRAKLYWYMGEYDVYQNEKAMFEAEWDELVRDECEREHRGTG